VFRETDWQKETIKRLGCTYRFFTRTLTPPPDATPEERARLAAQCGECCEIIDLASTPLNDEGRTNMNLAKGYVIGMGATQPEALTDALEKALKADKPLTPAQAAEDPELRKELAETRRRFHERKGGKAAAVVQQSHVTTKTE